MWHAPFSLIGLRRRYRGSRQAIKFLCIPSVADHALGDDALDQSWEYDIASNITWNARLGSYSYGPASGSRPHAPSSVAGQALHYDANGNMTVGLEGRSIAYDASNSHDTC